MPKHPKYRTESCRTWMTFGHCPFGGRCAFIHDPTQANVDGRKSGAGRGRGRRTHSPSATKGGRGGSGMAPMLSPEAEQTYHAMAAAQHAQHGFQTPLMMEPGIPMRVPYPQRPPLPHQSHPHAPMQHLQHQHSHYHRQQHQHPGHPELMHGHSPRMEHRYPMQSKYHQPPQHQHHRQHTHAQQYAQHPQQYRAMHGVPPQMIGYPQAHPGMVSVSAARSKQRAGATSAQPHQHDTRLHAAADKFYALFSGLHQSDPTAAPPLADDALSGNHGGRIASTWRATSEPVYPTQAPPSGTPRPRPAPPSPNRSDLSRACASASASQMATPTLSVGTDLSATARAAVGPVGSAEQTTATSVATPASTAAVPALAVSPRLASSEVVSSAASSGGAVVVSLTITAGGVSSGGVAVAEHEQVISRTLPSLAAAPTSTAAAAGVDSMRSTPMSVPMQNTRRQQHQHHSGSPRSGACSSPLPRSHVGVNVAHASDLHGNHNVLGTGEARKPSVVVRASSGSVSPLCLSPRVATVSSPSSSSSSCSTSDSSVSGVEVAISPGDTPAAELVVDAAATSAVSADLAVGAAVSRTTAADPVCSTPAKLSSPTVAAEVVIPVGTRSLVGRTSRSVSTPNASTTVADNYSRTGALAAALSASQEVIEKGGGNSGSGNDSGAATGSMSAPDIPNPLSRLAAEQGGDLDEDRLDGTSPGEDGRRGTSRLAFFNSLCS
jgi:Zinc finger C-x8-C-x5-C-x3-H type (and similar)